MREHDPQYRPNLRGENVYYDVYEHDPEFRVWNNTMYEIPPQGLVHYGYRFPFHYNTQTNVMQVPELPPGNVLCDAVEQVYSLLYCYPKLYQHALQASFKDFLAFVGHRQTAKPCKEKTDDKSVACCTCRSRYNMHSLVQSITNSVRTLVKTTEKNKGKTKKERNSALFLQILSISMYVLFGYFGKDARVSPFANYLQKIHDSLMKLFLYYSSFFPFH